MPRIEQISEVLHQPNDPIHWEIDNLPLKSILERQNLINLALDNVIEQLRDAVGTQGSVANRLNQSIEPDGSLKTDAIDDALHSIAEHTDGTDYVRMTVAQSNKLDLIDSEATDVTLRVFTDDTNSTEFANGEVKLKPSDAITPVIEAPDIVKFNLAFDTSAAHQHHYDLTPVHVTVGDPDYINYKVNATSTAYVEGSLRVFINGSRLSEDDEIYVPGALVDDPWTSLSFTSDDTNGTFTLSSAITEDDIIKIDFDISLV